MHQDINELRETQSTNKREIANTSFLLHRKSHMNCENFTLYTCVFPYRFPTLESTLCPLSFWGYGGLCGKERRQKRKERRGRGEETQSREGKRTGRGSSKLRRLERKAVNIGLGRIHRKAIISKRVKREEVGFIYKEKREIARESKLEYSISLQRFVRFV